MMSKADVLGGIRDLARAGLLDRDELLAAHAEGLAGHEVQAPKAPAAETPDLDARSRFNLGEILYFLGGGIVVFGIAVFLAQNWGSLNGIAKIAATLGAGTAAYVTAVILIADERTEKISSAFFLIAALVMPLGMYVTLDVGGIGVGYGLMSGIAALLLAIYLVSYFLFGKNVLLLFGIFFATCLFFSFTGFVLSVRSILESARLYEQLWLAVGLSYMLLAYSFEEGPRAPLSGFLYGAGVFAFLGAALLLTGWRPHQSPLWEAIFPFLTFAAMYLSVVLRNQKFLIFGTLFLMLYLVKITAQYFSNSLGWPLALVVSGFLLVAAGAVAIHLKRKYISA